MKIKSHKLISTVGILLSILHSSLALADANPITYGVTLDYNSLTGNFENPRLSGSSSISINTSGSTYPIEISSDKDGVTGLTVRQAGGGNQQYAIRRTYSGYNFTLTHESDSSLTIPIAGFLRRSAVISSYGPAFFNNVNNGCDTVRITPSVLEIVNSSPNCSGKTPDSTLDITFTAGNTRMIYVFDTANAIKTELNKSEYKAGLYRGTIQYTGDSIFSRVGGRMTESYTFNFTINKLRQLSALNFPDGTNVGFNVNETDSNYLGTSSTRFDLDGLFLLGDKVRFTLTSQNSVGGKLSLSDGASPANHIDYSVNLVDSRYGQPNVFTTSGENKVLTVLAKDNVAGLLNFSFTAPRSSTPNGTYTDNLTVLVELVL